MKRMIVVTIALLALGAALAGCAKQQSVTETPGGTRVAISVTEDGFVPAAVHVSAGKPVTLVVTRKTTKTCATELVMADYDIHRELPLGETVEIQFTPRQAGEVRYACGMDMIAGKIVMD